MHKMLGAVGAWRDRLLDWLYPEDALCPLCRSERIDGTWLCRWCGDTFPWVRTPLCPLCGRPVEEEGPCHDCGTAERIFDSGVGAAVYRGEAKAAIRALKYSGARWHALWMGAMMGERVRVAGMRPECVIPVPLHPHRLKTRGYNQAGLLAEHAARYLELPLWEDVLMRSVDTPTQTRLGREERLANMHDAFGLLSSGGVAGREVLLVDDIMTTGATLEACAGYLKKAGAIRVDTAVFSISTGNMDMQ